MKVKLLREFWGHRTGTMGFLRATRDGRAYLKLRGSPRAYVKETDNGALYGKAES